MRNVAARVLVILAILFAGVAPASAITLDELAAQVAAQGIEIKLLKKRLALSGAQVAELEQTVDWLTMTLLPAQSAQLGSINSMVLNQEARLDQIESEVSFLGYWLGQNGYKLDQLWSWYGQHKNAFTVASNGPDGKMVVFQLPVSFSQETSFEKDSFYQCRVHMNAGFDGYDLWNGNFSSEQYFGWINQAAGKLETVVAWVAQNQSLPEMVDLLADWALPLMNRLFYVQPQSPDMAPYVVIKDDLYVQGETSLMSTTMNGQTIHNGSIELVTFNQCGQATYHDLTDPLLCLSGQYEDGGFCPAGVPEAPATCNVSGGGGGGAVAN